MLNKKIFISTLYAFLFVTSLCYANTFITQHARMIYIYASKANISGLRRVTGNYGIDTMDTNGDTAVCYAIKNNDVKTYKALAKMGAKSQQYCLDRTNYLTKKRFEKSLAEYDATTVGVYNERGTLLTRTKYAEPEKLSTASKVGLGVGAIALIGGGVAAASGGGGGGSSGKSNKAPNSQLPSDLPENNISCEERGGTLINGECIIYNQAGAAPKSDNINNYHTKEYSKGDNFLSQIGADFAYARGYTGYIVNRDENGFLINDGSNLITDKKIKVGVLDSGFDIYHPDLIDNIVKDKNGNPYGYNFDYGPCRNGDTSNCYGFKLANDSNLYGSVVLYDENGEIIAATDSTYTQPLYENKFKDYPDDYDWDKLKNNPVAYLINKDGVDSRFNTEDNDHGTHVMGIIGASINQQGMQGVAPNVEMVGINRTQTFTTDNTNIYKKAMETLINENARVVNMSFGIETTDKDDTKASYLINKNLRDIEGMDSIHTLFAGLADNDIVTVKSAGNEGNNYEADILSGIPLSNEFKQDSEYDLTNLFITVVSVNSKNDLAYYSQKCGSTKGYCLAAPGGDYTEDNMIYSTVQNDNNHQKDENGNAYGYMQGTSMAAPVVTGSVALLMGAYPHLSSQQIVEILFKTATDIGDKGIDDKFGHGLLNLEAATSPIGYLSFDFANGENSENYTQSALRLSKSANSKILKSLPKHFIAFDEYNRGFKMKTSSLMLDTANQRKHLFENDFKAFMSNGVEQIKATDNLSFGFNTSVAGNDIHSPYGFLEINYAANNQTKLNAFYSENTVLNASNPYSRTEQNPFISMDNAFGLGLNHKLGKTLFKVDFISGKNNFFDDENNSDLYNNRMNVLNSELTYSLNNNLRLSSAIGMLKENGSILGMVGTNAFDFNNSYTYYGGMKISYSPTSKLSLSGAYYRGHTNTAINSSVFNMSDIESESIAFNATYNISKESNLGFDIYSPLRIVKGIANIYLASGRHPTENKVYMHKYQASLKDTQREWDLSMFYNTKLKEETNFKTRLGIRLNPEHDANSKPDYFGMFNLNFAF